MVLVNAGLSFPDAPSPFSDASSRLQVSMQKERPCSPRVLARFRPPLLEHLRHHPRRLDAGEFLVESAMPGHEPRVIDAHEVQDRGVKITRLGGGVGDVVREVVGGPVFRASLHAPAPASWILNNRP